MVAALPRNGDLADQFDLLADLSEILGEQSFRVAAYRRAAARIRDTASSVAELALEGKAKELPDIGKTIEAKIVEVVETGDMEALAKRRAEVPGEVSSFMRLPGLGPKTAARIWRELGVTTLAELKAAAEGEQLRTLSGMGAATEAKILKALAEGQGDDEPRRGPAREGAARRARGRRDAAGAPCRDRRLRRRQHAPPARDVPRSRRDRDRDRPGRADRVLRRASRGCSRSSPTATRRRP